MSTNSSTDTNSSGSSQVNAFASLSVSMSPVPVSSSPVVHRDPSPNDLDDIDHQESFFESYWNEISVFSFDKAKDIAEKEKESALKTHVHNNLGSSGFTWVILTTALSQIAATEKAYLNLVFLAPKGFLRKDCNLKSTLESIRHDVKKIAESSVSSSPARHQNTKVASAVLMLVALRLDLMEFYEKLSLLGTAKNVEISDILSDAELIYEKFNDEKTALGEAALILKGIIKSLSWECEIIINLLKAHSVLQTCEYLQATIALQTANNKLNEWGETLQAKETIRKSSVFYKPGPSYPALYLWIWKLKAALVSKFTIYFYDILAKNSSPTYDIKAYCAKLQTDYFYKISLFQKKSDALSVCIIFDAKDTNFHPLGYQHLQRATPSPQGLESYPAILAIPGKPATHWPNVVMIISDRLQDLNSDKFVGFYDKRVQSTYFLYRVDVRMYMLTIYETKKNEKDSYTQKFMNEIATDFKLCKIFSSIKCVK